MATKKEAVREAVEITFAYEKSTKGAHRYQEEAEDPKVGTLYVRKSAFPEAPAKLRVTIETSE